MSGKWWNRNCQDLPIGKQREKMCSWIFILISFSYDVEFLGLYLLKEVGQRLNGYKSCFKWHLTVSVPLSLHLCCLTCVELEAFCGFATLPVNTWLKWKRPSEVQLIWALLHEVLIREACSGFKRGLTSSELTQTPYFAYHKEREHKPKDEELDPVYNTIKNISSWSVWLNKYFCDQGAYDSTWKKYWRKKEA